MAVTRKPSTFPLAGAAYAGGLVAIFLGERVFGTIGAVRATLWALGALGVLGSIGLRLTTAGEDTERRAVERKLAALSLVTVVALLLELATTELGETILGIASLPAETRPRFEDGATVVWISLLAIATLPILFAERALMPMRRAARIEERRVSAARMAGLTLALAAAYGALFAYTAGELNTKVDFSYFRTSRPGEATRKIVAELNQPVKALAFFPQLNEVGHEVEGYLRDLAKASPNFSVEVIDRMLSPRRAHEEKVDGDGVIVLVRGSQRETVPIGVDMTASRAKLKTLDTEVQKGLLKVARPARTAYLTTGHGELNEPTTEPSDEGRTIQGVNKLLQSQGYTVKNLGLQEGLGTAVPADATLVLILGPARPFLPGEVTSLRRYADRGGHIFMALDPEAKAEFNALTELGGLTIGTSVLANDRAHLRRRFNDSDRTIIVASSFSSHASVSTLSRNSSHMPVIFPGAAALDKKQGADPSYKIDFAVKSMSNTFSDDNGDFQPQEGEKHAAFNLAAAVSHPAAEAATTTAAVKPDDKKPDDKGKPAVEARLFILADGDVITDAALSNEPNILLFLDAVRWLGGDESFAGAMSTTEDVKIEHTKQKDLVWFYGTIFGVPSLVLGLGLWLGRRPRRASASAGAA